MRVRPLLLLLTPLVAASLFSLMFVLCAPMLGMKGGPVTTSVAYASDSVTETVYPFLEFDEPRGLDELDQPSFYNEFYGGGTFDGCCSGTSELQTTRDDTTYFGDPGASLRLAYTLTTHTPDFGSVAYAQSLFGDPFQDRFSLNLDNIYGVLSDTSVSLERFEFYVRGSGATTDIHTVRLQFKDRDDVGVYRDFTIPDTETTWTKISVPLDFSAGHGWTADSGVIDRTRMKQVSFMMMFGDNPQSSGVWYLDHATFVDEDSVPLSLDTATDDQFLDLASKRAFQYFLDWYDQDSGMWESRSVDHGRGSIGLVGFGLSAMIIGAERGWIPESYAHDIISNTLTKLADGQTDGSTPSQAINQNGYRGFYWHFLNIGTGGAANRAGTSELSPVDTALGMMGVVYARQHYINDPQIVALADEILGRVQWKWFLDTSRANNLTGGGSIAPANQTYLAWAPECGTDFTIWANDTDSGDGCFSTGRWDYTTDEVMLINLLGIGSPNPSNRVDPDTFYAWQRVPGTYAGHDVMRTFFGSLFTYFFAQEYIDWGLLGRDNDPTPSLRVNWQVNAQNAARANQAFVAAQYAISPTTYPTYAPPRWGLTVSDGPGKRVACGGNSYCNYGAPPLGLGATGGTPEGTPIHDGTLQPYGSASMMQLAPDIALPSLKSFYTDTLIWRERFGFGDAVNLNPQKVDPSDVIPYPGQPFYNYVLYDVDNSPILMGINNYRNGTTRSEIMTYPPFREALCKLFLSTDYCIAPIHVDVFDDSNQNGTRNIGEGALAGWSITATVRLTQTNSLTGPVVATTSGSGADFQSYSNDDVGLCLTLKPGWTATNPTCQSVAIQQDGDFTATFGVHQTTVTNTLKLTLTKVANLSNAHVGDTITYTYRITNTGTASLTINAVDNKLGAVTGLNNGGPLAVNGKRSATLSHLVNADDLTHEPLVNKVVVTGTDTLNAHVVVSATASVHLLASEGGTPKLTVSLTPNASVAHVGDTVTYTYRITNTGTVSLTIHAVDNELGAVIGLNNGGALAVNAPRTATLSHLVTANDLAHEPFANGVVVTGTDSLNAHVTVSASASVHLLPAQVGTPLLAVSLKPNTSLAHVGDIITYTYRITNTGTVPLTIRAVDNKLGAVTGLNSGGALAVNAPRTTTLSHLVTDDDLAHEPFVNKIVVTGTDALNAHTTVSATASVHITPTEEPVEHTPDFTLSLTVTPTNAQVGDTIIFTYRITNTGDVTITSIVTHEGLSQDVENQVAADSLLAGVPPGQSTGGTIIATVAIDNWPGPVKKSVSVTVTGSNGLTRTKSATVTISLNPNEIALPLLERQ